MGNTSSATPMDPAKDNGYICPKGYYCPAGSMSPKSCPKGTFGSKTGLSSPQCQACPSGTYSDEIGMTACKSCGGSSRAQPGAESCKCIGLNRMYLRDVQKCVCKPGFKSTDGTTTDQDSSVDCEEIIYNRCTDGQEQDQFGVCRDVTDCTNECDGGSGTIQPSLGVCQCDSAQNTDDVCNPVCRAAAKKISYTSDGKIQVYDPVLKTT